MCMFSFIADLHLWQLWPSQTTHPDCPKTAPRWPQDLSSYNLRGKICCSWIVLESLGTVARLSQEFTMTEPRQYYRHTMAKPQQSLI